MSTATGDSKKSQLSTSSSMERSQPFRRFEFGEIKKATNNFEEVIGKGHSGYVYKGTFINGSSVSVFAVKRLDAVSRQGVLQLLAEAELLSKLRHCNLVSLIGYCKGESETLLVYEYMPDGTLKDNLHKLGTPLSWVQRLKICISAGRGLDYLHTGAEFAILHCDVNSSNVFLHESCAAKISGFWLSKVVPTNQIFSVPCFKDSFGYLDPCYISTGRLTMKSDVYAFGVLLFEVLCRKPPVSTSDEEQRLLARRAIKSIKAGNIKDMIDSGIRGQVSTKCLKEFVGIAERCIHHDPKVRPTMAGVVVRLESVLALQEKMNSSQLAGQTISGRMAAFSRNQQKSGGSYIGQNVKLSPAKSHGHTGDYGPMSDSVSKTVADASSEESYPLEKGLKQKMLFSNEEITRASELNRKFIDRESGDQTDSLYEYIRRADVMMRMMNLLHLIWFYPVKNEAEVNFRSLVDNFSLLKEYIRKSLDSSRDENYLMTIQTLLQYIEEHLDAAAFDMNYLPEGLMKSRSGYGGLIKVLGTGADSVQVPFTSFWSGIPEIHRSAVAAATHRAVSCIKDLKIKKLGIFGSGAKEVAETLKNMHEIERAFDMVLSIHVEYYDIIKLRNNLKAEIHQWKKRRLETGNKKNVQDQFVNCLLFIDCNDDSIDLHEPESFLSEWVGTVQMVMTSRSQNAYWGVDIEIRVEDHLLPWILFSTHADLTTMGKISNIQQMATLLIEKCNGHLLAIILLARALRDIVDLRIWELALQKLASQEEPSSSSKLGVTSDVMVRVLIHILSRIETLCERCIIHFASHCIGAEFEKSSLVNRWIRDGLVKTEQEGENVFQDLIRSFLLEQVGGNSVRMRDEIRVILLDHFVPRAYGLYLKEDGSESNRMPNSEEWNAREIHLSNNIISELPDNPDCPILVNLFLHCNQDLCDIPITFFDNMPSLQVLHLSGTSLKCLPSSISKLTTLQKLYIRDCDLLMELPPEIGDLKNLRVFDSEGTQLVCLPEQFGSLTKLECLKFSLYNFADKHKRSNPSMQISPATVLSKLIRLRELIIFVDLNLSGEWWEDEVKLIINILPNFWNLESLRLYFPNTELLAIFMETQSWRRVPIYQHLSNFGFIVGHLQRRLISRVPLALHKTFVKLPKCLTYTNGEGDIDVISMALTHANALFLDRHWTIQSLSAFGLAEMEKLKFCLLSECNEMLEIADGNHFEDSSLTPVLGSLEHLSIHYMKSLRCMWNGPIHSRCLSNLKTLAIHSCPELRSIFTQGFLDSLNCLEYLIVEDCTTIKSLVSLRSNASSSTPCLPSLRKIALVHLPQLVSISRGISIAPRLESLVVYDCPNLEELSYMEASDDLREIKGENEWWDALKWCEPEWTSGQPDYLARVFTPLGTDGDIMDELADAVNLLPHLRYCGV